MIKISLEFFSKLQQVLLLVKFFHFGQMLFNLVHTFAAHHEKSSVPVIFKVSFDHLFDNLESGKINSCFGKKSGKSLEFWIQKPCVMYNPYNKSPESVTITK